MERTEFRPIGAFGETEVRALTEEIRIHSLEIEDHIKVLEADLETRGNEIEDRKEKARQ